MCGIFGGVALSRPLVDETRAALRGLVHRGPDGEGIADLPGAVLGHRRLSIIDLSHAADQPLWDVRRQVAIVFNGEIYNFRELREECRRAGLEFASESDTEVIVNQYLLHGPASFDRLNGMFAFCLYDSRSGDSYLARDPFGIKPLYYAQSEQGVLFASELQVLLDAGIDVTIDQAALQAYLQLDFVPAPHSIVRGARKLEGGSYLRVERGGRTEMRRFFERRPAEISGDPLEEFSARIDAAVRRHLISDVPLGVFLSGGIDSSIVAEAATRLAGPLSTFSVGFQESSYDESRYFSAVARGIGARPHTRTLSAQAMLDLVPEIARRLGEPLADGSIYPTYLLARFAREHVTVALSGDGADELFAGYQTYFAHRLVRPLPAFTQRALRRTRGIADRLLPVVYENFSRDFQIKKFLGGLDPDLVCRHIRWMGTFEPEELPRLLQEYDAAPQRALVNLLAGPASATDDGWLEKVLRTDQRFYLQDGVLVKVDRASMASSLEVRVPFLDRQVIAFADALGPKMKLHGRTSKALLRRYVAQRFPPEIARRPKQGFGVPLGRWFRGELRPLLEQTLSPAKLEEVGLFRPQAVATLLEEHWQGRRDNRKKIFNLLSFMLWYENFRPGSGKVS